MLSLAALTGTPAAAQEAEVPPADAPTAVRPPLIDDGGGSKWSFFYGYGFNHAFFESAKDVDITTAGVRWTHLWETKGEGFVRGNPGLGIELVPVMQFVEPHRRTWALGANLMYEHHFAAHGRVVPIWKIGVGVLYAQEPVPEQVTRHNFSLLTGLGADIAITERSALFAGYRFHHVSNASTGEFNPGINVHSVFFGLSLYR